MLNRLGQRISQTGNDVAYAAYTRTTRREDRIESSPAGGAPSSSRARPVDLSAPLSEETVYRAFHEHTKRAVFEAVRAGLITKEQVEDLDPDIMFVVPALTLLRAAVASNAAHAVPVPSAGNGVYLTQANCPAALRPMLTRWQALAPRIKAQQSNIKTLRLYLAGRGADATSAPIKELASAINGLAIEITQRRTYQDRFQADVQCALSQLEQVTLDAAPAAITTAPSASPAVLPSAPPMPSQVAPLENDVLPESPELDMIRETLYGAIADELDVNPALGELLGRDRARALFGATALAMAHVSETVADATSIRVVLPVEPLTQARCPAALRPLFDLLTSRHAMLTSLTPAERTDLRAQLLGTEAANAAPSTRVLALAGQLSVATARVMSLPRHLTNIERAFAVFGY